MPLAPDEKTFSDINITPLVDVCLVLVISLMLSAPFFIQSGIDVNRTGMQAFGLSTPQENVLVVVVDQEKILIGGNKVKWEDAGFVMAKSLQESPMKVVLIRAAKEVPHGTVVRILDIAKQNGAQQLALMR